MVKLGLVICALIVAFSLLGCGKKKQTQEALQEPISLETLSVITAQTQTPTQVKSAVTPVASLSTAEVKPLPPAGPYRPTVQEIQVALKNAGYYTGEIDGKIGPLTKKAIKDFQKANNLEVDGKVGPKTWAILGTYLKKE
ncbi:MAG: peptidoglycan-binding protein [Candidatus Omnitrophica bacterium]|nr:peptidoglycan-binding protein [Candidatus Omnitrophota bacterium]